MNADPTSVLLPGSDIRKPRSEDVGRVVMR
ncbi:hypothetical protein FB565_000226 [Actinoplanes lutulentus]|uniref:Uncharacterized protein n=1 Tax=Actinoplanes lutulentus TaxID=1287878 RepID=A0A327YWJ7_9ACTN|nr:hypothetical protein [Actinoplanes lutulentus]RAK25504.1 hypothetical protein B0I29_13343 [Actinoplanes lutulentus]